MRSPTDSGLTHEHEPADRPDRGAGSRGGGCAGHRAGRRAARPGPDFDRPGNAGRRSRGRRGRAPAAARGRSAGDQRAVRHHPRRAAGHRPQGYRGGREETAVTLWWIGDAVLLVVVLPVVVYLLHGVLSAARSIVPSVRRIAATAAAGSRDLDATALLLTTQSQVQQTVAGVANYGGSLDVIIDDAEKERSGA